MWMTGHFSYRRRRHSQAFRECTPIEGDTNYDQALSLNGSKKTYMPPFASSSRYISSCTEPNPMIQNISGAHRWDHTALDSRAGSVSRRIDWKRNKILNVNLLLDGFNPAVVVCPSGGLFSNTNVTYVEAAQQAVAGSDGTRSSRERRHALVRMGGSLQGRLLCCLGREKWIVREYRFEVGRVCRGWCGGNDDRRSFLWR